MQGEGHGQDQPAQRPGQLALLGTVLLGRAGGGDRGTGGAGEAIGDHVGVGEGAFSFNEHADGDLDYQITRTRLAP